MTHTLTEARFSEARSQLSRVFDEVVEDLRPVLIRRKGREEALLVRRAELEVVLEPFTLSAQVMREQDGSVTIAVDELE
ncbi:MAG: type II toxin-antitoxin system Phd/YefM family antitoxin, partial [Gemmatimonadales bacterium]